MNRLGSVTDFARRWRRFLTVAVAVVAGTAALTSCTSSSTSSSTASRTALPPQPLPAQALPARVLPGRPGQHRLGTLCSCPTSRSSWPAAVRRFSSLSRWRAAPGRFSMFPFSGARQTLQVDGHFRWHLRPPWQIPDQQPSCFRPRRQGAARGSTGHRGFARAGHTDHPEHRGPAQRHQRARPCRATSRPLRSSRGRFSSAAAAADCSRESRQSVSVQGRSP